MMNSTSEPLSSPTFCVFQCREQRLAVDVNVVVEVIEPGQLVRVPLGPPPLLGLCAYRGGVVPVAWAGEGERPRLLDLLGNAAILIVRVKSSLWGLAIDRGGVSVVVDGWARRFPESRRFGFLNLLGETQRDGVPLFVVDAERSWEQLRSGIVAWYGELSGCEPLVCGSGSRTAG